MLAPPAARDQAVALVDLARRKGADAADAVYVGERSQGVSVRLGALEDVHRSEGEEIGLRLFRGTRSASVASSDLSADALTALVGVRSSARALGERIKLGVGVCYALALAGWAAAIWSVRPDPLALLALLPAAGHLARQAARADPDDGDGALALFRSNRFTGLLLFAGFLAVGLSSA